jgi:hypothetical protein
MHNTTRILVSLMVKQEQKGVLCVRSKKARCVQLYPPLNSPKCTGTKTVHQRAPADADECVVKLKALKREFERKRINMGRHEEHANFMAVEYEMELVCIEKMKVQTQNDIDLFKIDFSGFSCNDTWFDEQVKQHLCAAEHKLTRIEKRIRKTQRALRLAYTVWQWC